MAENDDIDEEMMMEPGFRGRVALSIIVGIGWLIFLIIWLAFYAQDFNVYQNIAIFLVSILAVAAILGSAWAHWGMKFGSKFKGCK